MKGSRKYMLGQPKYDYRQEVTFTAFDAEKTGRIYVIDAYGTFEQSEEVSYDVYVKSENCLYKHIRESCLKAAETTKNTAANVTAPNITEEATK